MISDRLLTQTITHFVSQFYTTNLENDIALNTLKDSLSAGQLNSKLRLLELCQKYKITAKSALFLGHWHGLLPLLLKNFGIIESAVGIESNQIWVDFSNVMNCNWTWQSECADATLYSPIKKYDLVVNTSCEHMNDDWIQNVQTNTVVIAQSTNYIHPEHINSCDSLREFQNRFQGFNFIAVDELTSDIYKRFTVIIQRKEGLQK